MNKKIIFFSIFVLMASLLLFPGRKERQQDWQKAITQQDTTLKFQYLQEYEQKYGNDKKDRMRKFCYLNLTNIGMKLKKYDDVIVYGEKTLTFPEIEGGNKLGVYLNLANAFKVTKQDLEKAYNYAGKVVEYANELITQYKASEQEAEKVEKYINSFKAGYQAPALRIQTYIIYDRGKDKPEIIKEAASKACEAYDVDKSQKSSGLVFRLAYQMYKKKQYDDAVPCLELIFDKDKPDSKICRLLGSIYRKKNDKDKAFEYMEMGYKLQRKSSSALNLGKMIHKKDLLKGINYFAEAFLLGKSDKTSDAYKFLENLFFNKYLDKAMPPAEREKAFHALLNQVRARLGMEAVAAPAAPAAPVEETTDESEAEGEEEGGEGEG
ncbi:MAG: hypothetical protein GY765_27020 [bacterium]|nr:hypothetical protein [bacterium]